MSYAAWLCERVRLGGPIYTHYEMDEIQKDVLNNLVAEFGPYETEDDIFSEDDMNIAVGWPYSHSDYNHDTGQIIDVEAEQESEDTQVAAALLSAIESGDRDQLDEAISIDVKLERQRKTPPPIPLVPYDPFGTYAGPTVGRCSRCGQRCVTLTILSFCSKRCQKLDAEEVAKRKEEDAARKIEATKKRTEAEQKRVEAEQKEREEAKAEKARIREREKEDRQRYLVETLPDGKQRYRLPECWCIDSAISTGQAIFNSEGHTDGCQYFRYLFPHTTQPLKNASAFRWLLQMARE